ncbi:hypothetical protein GIY30_23285 [Gordonia sp. HNM0687]|uniref:SnoaL-like domain-containing protein n=1 Tax=Gordonia mangrovi TaxID=2665643 RepID=A0A6L7GYA7_9ACTN|nr:nuclear transport factor 2 family protein [Gordonia mangrovi]MXP24251.1 hypothetical protein [Gordonia mangrovi]UVF79928.1 nuclear transport factor 2 family protein [Gordonia mangrovi]
MNADERLRRMMIHFELSELGARYSVAVDDHDIKAVLDCFTANGSFVHEGTAFTGHDTLRTFYVA